MQAQPRGTVTFLFTDIEGSTRLWHRHPATMPAAYERHDTACARPSSATAVRPTRPSATAFQVAFPDAASGIGAALDAQRALQAESWRYPEPAAVRMALHTGPSTQPAMADYRSPVLNRLGPPSRRGPRRPGPRLAGDDGAGPRSPAGGASLSDLGEQRLKDLFRPERVWQLAHAGCAPTSRRRAPSTPARTTLPTQLT